jgi:hypothetical protein
VAKVGTSKVGGTISQQAVVHPWLAAVAHGKTNKQNKWISRPERATDHMPSSLAKVKIA